MFFQMHRNKLYLFFLVLLLFQTDVFAYKYAISQDDTTSKHYTQRESDYQRLPARNNNIFNQYSFSTFDYFYNLDFKGNTLFSKYGRSLTWFLLEKSLYFDRMYNSNALTPEDEELINFNRTWEESEDEKKRVLIHAVWNASYEVISESSLYQKYKYYVYEIESYLFIEYSKSILDTNPVYYLPGESSVVKRKEKKSYKMSLSAHLAPDDETAHIGTRVKFSTIFFNVKSNVVYLFRDQSTTFSTSNLLLNSYLGGDLKLSVLDLLQQEKVYILGLEYFY